MLRWRSIARPCVVDGRGEGEPSWMVTVWEQHSYTFSLSSRPVGGAVTSITRAKVAFLECQGAHVRPAKARPADLHDLRMAELDGSRTGANSGPLNYRREILVESTAVEPVWPRNVAPKWI